MHFSWLNWFIGLVMLTVAGGIVFVVAGKITLENDDTLAPVGITTGEPDEYVVTEDVQQFFDECTGKGGIITGKGGVKERLPTTEEGYTCWYQDRDCWDFLTYSKERFMGGNPGCPEANLVDKVVPVSKPTPVPTPVPQPTPAPKTDPTPIPVIEEMVIIPSANELVGTWSGSGVLSFTGSLYCNSYTIDWSSVVTKISEERVSGQVYDGEGDMVGTLVGTWSETQQLWTALITSDIFTTSNGTMDESAISGNIAIKNAWLPCDDITGQSGTFSGSKE